MKQFIETLLKFLAKVTINSNSQNKTEYHFHGPVNFIGSPRKKLKAN
jgi:hypothetical protein